jgi:Zn-dependent metalloprotease
MMSMRKLIPWILIALLMSSVLAARAATYQSVQGQPPALGVDRSVADRSGFSASASQEDDWNIYYHSATGKVRFMGSDPSRPHGQPAALQPGGTPEDAALSFLEIYGDQFGLKDPSSELVVKESTAAVGGRNFVRFQQIYQGVPVMAGELIVQTDALNNVVSAGGEVAPDLDLSTNPLISSQQAGQIALQVVARTYKLEMDALEASQPELWLYSPLLLGAPGVPLDALAWRIEVQARDQSPLRELVLVDARLGAVLLHFNQVNSAKYRLVFENNNNFTLGLPGGGPLRSEGGPATGIADVDNAYNYLGDTYDFFASRFGRDSIDGQGMRLVATTRYCPSFISCPYANAFWNGSQMVFGEGYASADDVVAHELAHGVTQYEANLFYYMQSGAINESFSDIWGEFIDLTNAAGSDAPANRWKLGEDLPGGAIRNMQDPPFFGDPDHMSSGNYKCGYPSDSDFDEGGVHSNSGVGNKAAYLLVDGGNFNGVTVSGISLEKAVRIYYEVQTNLLTSGADYADLSSALVQACFNLSGVVGINAADCDSVTDVINATEMLTQPTSCTAPQAAVCGLPLVNSQFTTADPNWAPVNGTWNTTNGSLFTTPQVNHLNSIAYQNEFQEVDFRVNMRRTGADNGPNSIIVRGTPLPLWCSGPGECELWSSAYVFSYNQAGNFSVSRYDGSSYTMLVDWTPSSSILTGNQWNIARVVASGDQLMFYVNGTLLWHGVDSHYHAGEVGIGVMASGTVGGDSLQVDWATLDGGTPAYLFQDDFENPIRGNWSPGAAPLSKDLWFYPQSANPFSMDGTYSSSGNYNLWGYDQAEHSDTWMAMNGPGISLPVGLTTYLHFNHAYQFDTDYAQSPADFYDGGLLEYSIDNGTTWQDTGSLPNVNGYNGTLSDTPDQNPFEFYPAFVGYSHGMISSRYDLSALAGSNVRFRFRIGTGLYLEDLGWFIDDVKIYTCSNQVSKVYLPLIFNGSTGTQSIVHSPFNGDSPGWAAVNGVWFNTPADYVSEGLTNSWASASFNQDYSSAVYEARLKRAGCTTCENALIIRGSPSLVSSGLWQDGYYFIYQANGFAAVRKVVAGSLSTLWASTTPVSAVTKGQEWNLLRVEANGSNLKFYINNQQVWSDMDTSLTSGKIGVGISRNSTSSWDRLSVDWVTLHP